MKDARGRTIDYMRISVTDRCNLRCKYCMPEGVEQLPMEQILTFEEICETAEAAASLGIRYIKVTGGEPLVRRGCCDLVRMLKAVPGIEKVTITTNGVLLGQYLEELTAAGIDGINISLDTMDRKRYAQLTGFDMFDKVMESIQRAAAGRVPVKINAVSLANSDAAPGREALCDESWRGVMELARQYPVDVRFIEMMPVGYGKKFETINHRQLLAAIQRAYPEMAADERQHGYGPAVYYRIPGFLGSIGLISAIHGKFCESCNRIRLTSEGFLKPCLCYDSGVDLRPLLRDSHVPDRAGRKALRDAMQKTIEGKQESHCFEQPSKMTEQRMMSGIGG